MSGRDPFDVERAESYIPGDRRIALATGRPLPDRVSGSALFADISGFTPLAEAMATEFGARRGADQLAITLDAVISAVLDPVHRHGGVVIYFSGDAVTCWLDGDDGRLAAACGLAMQRAIETVGAVRLPSGAEIRLGMKVAVAVGRARRFVVGDPGIQLVDVLAGALMDRLAAVESMTGRGEVLLDAAAADALGDRLPTGERRTGEVLDAVVINAAPPRIALPERVFERATVVPPHLARQWLLPAVQQRMSEGRAEFLTELRVVVPVFVRFTGIDYDADERAPELLDAFVTRVQRTVDGYGGNLLQLTIGDKGAYLYLVFGSPVAHEDDAARACAAALDLLALQEVTAARQIAVGISRGGTRSGTYGHRFRRTFCCLGDPVNLAARLMAAASPGQVLVADAVARSAGDRLRSRSLPALTVKGKRDPVGVHEVLGLRRTGARGDGAPRGVMVGRDAELATLLDAAADARHGRGRVVGVTGEAGLGKSRLLAELRDELAIHATPTALGQAQSFGAPTAYHAFRDLLLVLFGLPDDAPADIQLARFETALQLLDPALTARAPLLGAITGVALPDNRLTAAMDAALRKGSLELLVAQYLDRRTGADGPLVLVLEDCHWLDAASQDLLELLIRQIAALPVLVVASYRAPGSDDIPAWLATLRRLPHAHELPLGELDDAAARALVAVSAGRLFGPRPLPEDLVDLVVQRAQGNPFHVQELLAFLRSGGIDVHDPAAVTGLEVPDSLQSLVLSRIDVLDEQPRRTIKIASVVGRTFETSTVIDVEPTVADGADSSTAVLTSRDLITPEPTPGRYVFRHVVVHDVAYDSLPFATRAEIHDRVGHHLERRLGTRSADRRELDLLAHHFWFGKDDARKRRYLRAAGDAARDAYAGEVAAVHYERLTTLLGDDDAELREVLARLGAMLELGARWTAAASCYERVVALASGAADRPGAGWGRVALADVVRRQGDFARSADLLEQAAGDFDAAGDESGLGRVLHLRGTLAGQQQQIEQARGFYRRSLEIRERLGERAAVGSLLANLGIMAEYEGDYAAAIALTEQALAVRLEVGDRWAIGHAHSNLGMLRLYADDVDAAVESLSAALRMHEEVGDLWMIAIGHDNLGSALLRRGDLPGAAGHLRICVQAQRLVADPWAAAHLLEDVARLAALAFRPADAWVLVGAADTVRADLGAPRSEEQQRDLDAALAVADAVDPTSRLTQGQGLSTLDALDRAGAVCAAVTGIN